MNLLMKRMLSATAIVLFAFTLYACGGGNSVADSGMNQAQFDALLKTSSVYASLVSQVNQTTSTSDNLKAAETVDAQQLAILTKGLFANSLANRTASTRSSTDYRTMGISKTVSPEAVNFGSCPNMGVKIGFGGGLVGNNLNPLATTQTAFTQCSGYSYAVDNTTGNLIAGPRIYWDGPNCTGNMYTWEAAGAGYQTQYLKNGVEFASPVDLTSPLYVAAGQTPQNISVMSLMLSQDQTCQSDVETLPMYIVSVATDTVMTTITDIPASVGSWE